MKRRILAASLLPCALVLGGLTVGTGVSAAAPVTPAAPAVAPAPPPIRIMFNGDSVTQEFAGDYSWRYRLIKEIQRQLAGSGKTINMVGPYNSPYYNPSGAKTRYHVAGWDSDHDAIGGSQLYHHITGGAYDIKRVMTENNGAYKPDVLISFLGTNDFLAGMTSINAAHPDASQARQDAIDALVGHVIDEYQQFVAEARQAVPDLKIVLGELVTHQIPPSVRAEYNQALAADVVADVADGGMSTSVSPIALAMLDRPEDEAKWEDTKYTFDRVHATPTGELLMAQRFGEALHSIDTLGDPATQGLLPQPSAVPQVYIPWAPAMSPRIVVSGRRIYVNCSKAMLAYGVLQMRVKMVTLHSGRTALGSFVGRTTWNSVRLAPGYYRIQAQGLRAYVTTPWTRSYTVKVPKPKKRR